jgi:hypothetical protein
MKNNWFSFFAKIRWIFICHVFTVFFLYAQPIMSFDETTYEFGEILVTEGIVYYDFLFTNTGDEALQILKVKSSCGCALPDWSKGFIKPGQRGYVRVLFNPKDRLGRFNQTVWVLSNDQYIPVKLMITGNVIYPLTSLRLELQPVLKKHKKLKDYSGIDTSCFEGVGPRLAERQAPDIGERRFYDVIVRFVSGEVQRQASLKKEWQSVELNQIINTGDRIKTGGSTRLELEMPDGSIIKISENSEFIVDEIRVPEKHDEDKLRLSLLLGKLWGRFKKITHSVQERIIETPTTVVSVRGTSLQLKVDDLHSTLVRVEEGSANVHAVEFKLDFMLYANQEILIKSGERPAGPLAYVETVRDDPGMCLKWENNQVVADNMEDPGTCLKCQNGKVIPDDTESPGLCQKCQNGKFIIDDTEDVGVCMKCQDGTPIQDDSFDPGLCIKCQNGEVIPDDTEDPGLCQKCQDGQIIADDLEDPGECLKCQNGESVPDDMEDPGECMKCKNGEAVPDDLEFVEECWKCENGRLVPDNTQTCDDGDPCTKNDRCVNGECIGDPVTSSENPDCP